MKVIKLNKNLVAKCNCSGQLWYILVDKPDFSTILGFQCSFCGNIIDVRITTVEPDTQNECNICKYMKRNKVWGNYCYKCGKNLRAV